MNGTWDLSIMYKGFDDTDFSADKSELKNTVDGLLTLAKKAEDMEKRATPTYSHQGQCLHSPHNPFTFSYTHK